MISACKFPGAGVRVLLLSIMWALLCVGQVATGLVRAGGGVVGSILQLIWAWWALSLVLVGLL
jgi:hypothetical protein